MTDLSDVAHSIITSWPVSFAVNLGVLVFVHELGHFLAAKRVGIRVLKFQLGFNPTVISFRRGDTEYGIGALPLGGYVKMAGENPDDVERDKAGNVVRRSDEFLSKSKWQRFQVLIMGPTMNILLAVLLTALVLYQGVEKGVYEDQPPVIGAIAEGSQAAGAGVRPGDSIEAVNDRPVATWAELYMQIGTRPDREVDLRVRRDGQPITLKMTPTTTGQGRFEVGDIGVFPSVHPHLASVTPGDPGARGGLKDGDVIVAVDGKPMTFHYQMRELIASHPEKPMKVTVDRGGVQETLTVTPDRHGTVGWLGVRPVDDTISEKPGAVQAVTMSVDRNIEAASLIFQALWGLVTREVSPKQLMGPVAIAQLSSETARLGWIAFFSLMASISLNLGLLNLMPIPVLDGGHILILLLEGLTRRDFSVRVKERMLLAGFVLLMLLMVTVIYNDLTRIRWVENLMFWR
jgi:regulator of sigma E protease